MFCLVGVAW
jgi:hypothetical protein